jgi:hypothetical protein
MMSRKSGISSGVKLHKNNTFTHCSWQQFGWERKKIPHVDPTPRLQFSGGAVKKNSIYLNGAILTAGEKHDPARILQNSVDRCMRDLPSR